MNLPGNGDELTFVALCSSGLEGALASELKENGFKVTYSSSGRVFFLSHLSKVPFLNLYTRTADRIALLVSHGPAKTFDELYELCRTSELRTFVDRNARMIVSKVKVTNSGLSATGAVASVVKKALVDNLGGTDETGPTYRFIVVLKNDELFLLLDTTGASALSKRGYRLKVGEAPLRETIAAALVKLSRWNESIPLFDPFCGSGTIPIEAGLFRAPNTGRAFDSEHWSVLRESWALEKRKATVKMVEMREKLQTCETFLHGSDVDPDMVEIARENAERAGVRVVFECTDFRNLRCYNGDAYVISNLPYGERLEDDVLRDIHVLRKKFPYAKFYLVHSSDRLERYFGKARKKFRFQNGGLWVWAYMYF